VWYKTSHNAVVTSKDDGLHETAATVQAAENTDSPYLHDSISFTKTADGDYTTIIHSNHADRYPQEVTTG